jgi:tripartite-type tricarboxylate transporter receptor subunit TctC
VYKPGADGAIGWKEAAKMSKPDGYTLTVCTPPKTMFNYILNPNTGYTMADFEPIAYMVFDPAILVVGMDSKIKTFQDLVDAAKKAPGQIRLSHSGNGSDDWYNAVMTAKLAGVSFNMVPFEGDAPAWQAAAGGHVDVSMNNVGVVTSLVQGKKLRALAVCTEKRIPSLPDVPTLKELGINHADGVYRGYFAPKGTPKEIVDILADALEKVAADPQFKAACAAVNLVSEFRRGDALKAMLAQQEESLRKIAKEMNLAP